MSTVSDTKEAWLERLELEYKFKDVIDLEGIEITRVGLEALAECLAKDRCRFWHRIFNTHPRIKEIKTTHYSDDVQQSDFKALVEAFQKNTGITGFTTDYRLMGKVYENEIRLQLMLNKSRQVVRGKKLGYFWDSYYYISFGWFLGGLAVYCVPVLSVLSATLIAIPLLYLLNQFYDSQLKKAKHYNYTEDQAVIESLKIGQSCAYSWIPFLNPKSWTPMAWLGYAIENNQYQKKFRVETPCFSLKSNHP